MKIEAVDILQLKPGMVLAQDIYDASTGVILLSAGYVITEKALEAIRLFSTQKEYFVYVPTDKQQTPAPDPKKGRLDKALFDNVELKKGKETVIKKGKIGEKAEVAPLPSKISTHAQKIYLDTFKAVKNLYEQSQFFNIIDLQELNSAAEKIAREIIRDPQVLLQICVLKAIDNYTFSHAVHVAIYTATLGKFLHYSSRELQELGLAGLLHDLGKVDIPPEIVNKPGILTAEEFKIMKEHVRYGFNRVCRLQGISRDVLSAIGQHHERMDGSGYPQKLKGREIHKWARLLAIADVYDAITTDRIYRDAVLPYEGAEILMSCTGQLDIELLNVFLRNISFYPVGSKVLLNSGETGIIIKNNQNLPLRPVIQILEEEGQAIKTVDLSQNLTIFITRFVKD